MACLLGALVIYVISLPLVILSIPLWRMAKRLEDQPQQPKRTSQD